MEITEAATKLGVSRQRIYQIDELRPFPDRGVIDPRKLAGYIDQQIEAHRAELERLTALRRELEK